MTKTEEKSFGWRMLKALPKGTILYTILRRVSRSGMTRIIDVILIEGNEPLLVRVLEHYDCVQNASTAWHKWGGDYKVHGCEMDMGVDLVYSLGQLVHGDEYYFSHKWL